MSPAWKRRAWPVLKALLIAAILVMVGRQFYRDLSRPELHTELELRPAWLVLAGGLYLAGFSFSGWFWYRLLQTFGERPHLLTTLRAYFVGQLGKYVPGKAWALLLRGNLVRGPDVRLSVAIITSFYEVLTLMAAGALVAALVFLIEPPVVPDFAWHPLLTGLLLLGLCGIPLLPGVFNFVVGRVTARFRPRDDFRLPRLRFGTLACGLLAGCGCWALLGLSTWTLLQGVLPEPPPLTVATWARLCAAIGLAYVAGFVILFMPSGVGVREYFLLRLLGFAGEESFIAAAVLLLRIVWTAAELVLAAALYWLGPAVKIDVAEPTASSVD
jgi:uncharacterized membrane protein YbhN (UPF0104 family)